MKRGLFIALCLSLAMGFASLGVWQLQRLEAKTRLIAQTDARLAAAPVAAPASRHWSAERAYTRVTVMGRFAHQDETLVQAVTALGPGWWVMTPLHTENGTVLVNRGYVPRARRDPADRASSQVHHPVRITGLMRASEPGGGFLRANAPQADRWYSRDVEAIADHRGLNAPVMPYFIDADAQPNPDGFPVGGLTVVGFANNHRIYALTWFGLCALSIVGAGVVAGRGRSR